MYSFIVKNAKINLRVLNLGASRLIKCCYSIQPCFLNVYKMI